MLEFPISENAAKLRRTGIPLTLDKYGYCLCHGDKYDALSLG